MFEQRLNVNIQPLYEGRRAGKAGTHTRPRCARRARRHGGATGAGRSAARGGLASSAAATGYASSRQTEGFGARASVSSIRRATGARLHYRRRRHGLPARAAGASRSCFRHGRGCSLRRECQHGGHRHAGVDDVGICMRAAWDEPAAHRSRGTHLSRAQRAPPRRTHAARVQLLPASHQEHTLRETALGYGLPAGHHTHIFAMGHRYTQLQAHQSSVSLHVAALLGIPWHALAVATAHRADEIFVGDEHGTLGFAIDPTAYSAHDAFMFKGANAVMWATGVRLASLVRHKSGEIMYFTRSSLVASIGGVIVVNPTPKQVDAMRPNIDYILLTPSL